MHESPPHSWIGDPTLLGWGITVVYLLTVILLVANVFKARGRNEPFSFWAFAAVSVLALGLNKQLDLQTWLGESAKAWVLANGLYEQRRMLQLGFVVALALGGGIAVWLLRRWILRVGKRYRLVALGLGLCVCFVVLRAASLHGLDRLLGTQGASEMVGAALELTALGVIAFGGVRWRMQEQH